jgi:hypothetical protein
VGTRQLHAVPERGRSLGERLQTVVDALIDDYPEIEKQVGVRSSDGAGGSSGGLAVPVNLEALTFLNEHYWYADEPSDEHTSVPPCARWKRGETQQPRCGLCRSCAEAFEVAACRSPSCGADPDNWRAGLKLTVLGLEASIRQALGFGQLRRQRPPGYEGHGTDDRVLDALSWIRKTAGTLVDTHPQLAETVRDELARVAGRCRGMLDGRGVRLDSDWNDCQHCGLKTVCSDQVDRAVCVNVDCRRLDGTRHCWQRDPTSDTWVQVDEPDRYGRGRNLSDEQLQKRVYGT